MQTGKDKFLGNVELGQGLGLAGKIVLDLEEFVFNFHSVECEGNKIVGKGINLGIEGFLCLVMEVGETRLEASNIWLEFFGDGSEGSIRRLLNQGEEIC